MYCLMCSDQRVENTLQKCVRCARVVDHVCVVQQCVLNETMLTHVKRTLLKGARFAVSVGVVFYNRLHALHLGFRWSSKPIIWQLV